MLMVTHLTTDERRSFAGCQLVGHAGGATNSVRRFDFILLPFRIRPLTVALHAWCYLCRVQAHPPHRP